MSAIRRRHRSLLLVASLVGTAAASLHAQEPVAADVPADAIPLPDASVLPEPSAPPTTTTPVAPAGAPSTNVTVNLISRLVQKGILTREEAAVLIQQAENDAAQAQAAAAAPIPLDPLTGGASSNETRVTYIPEVVKNQMRDQIQQELMAQAREEKWGTARNPDWTSKFKLFGDFRGRYEGIFFGDQNDPDALFTNFNAINTGTPYDVTNSLNNFSSLYNVDQDRRRARIRLRAGTEVLLGEGFNAGIRLATGESNSPTSPNQSLGASGGNFSKYAIWLDRAFLSYDLGPQNGDGEELTLLLGRFDNPFFSTEIQWDDDIGFDGAAFRGRVNLTEKVSTFFTGGLFPVFNTDLNFASNQPQKFDSTDKYLYGAQVGIDWKIDDQWKAKVALSYYDFQAIQGQLSDPFTPLSASDSGNTDSTRPGFAQRGNTYMPLRNITPTAANGFGTTNQYQYYGLASKFRNLTLTGRLDYDHYEQVKFALTGEITKNLGFDESEVASNAYSSGRPGRTINTPGDYEGGDLAWNLQLQIGHPAMDRKHDWLATLGYRYVESDSIVDGFTDSDFGGGGTNLKGFTLGAAYALTSSVRIGAKWMSADEIDGPPLATDTLQFDINARF
jgi:hypothetical protein